MLAVVGLFVGSALVAGSTAVLAQEPVSTGGQDDRGERAEPDGSLAAEGPEASRRSFASPVLAGDHWSRAALRRLHVYGLLPAGYDPSTLTLTRLEAARMFQTALARAEERGMDEVANLTRSYRARFGEEFAATVASLEGKGVAPGFRGGSMASFGYEGRTDAVLARTLTMAGDRIGPIPADDVSEPAGELQLGLNLHSEIPQLAFQGSVRREMDEWSARETYGILAFGDVSFWFGRRAAGFGPGVGGGLVLSGTEAYTGGGLFLTDGFRLPSVLRHLGSWRVEAFGSRLGERGMIDSPWFFGMRASLAPHERVRIGLNRGATFAGSNNPTDASFGNVLKSLVGLEVESEQRSNFENQQASLDLWVAPPLGRVPLALYVEYAVEDLASVTRQPAYLVGAHLAGLPGLPEAGLGFEVTHFTPSPEGSSLVWYDHRVFGTWTADGRPLGHPLGGEGTEWRVFTDAHAAASRLRVRTALFWRDRGVGNLFAPDRVGDAWGVGGRVEYRFASHLDLFVEGETESGDLDWWSGQSFAGLRLLF